MTQKANWKTITLILIGAIAFGLFSQFVLPKLIRPAVNVQLKEFAKAINADAPIMLTEDIRFDNVTLGKDNRIIYNYTLVNIHSKKPIPLTLKIKCVQQCLNKSETV